MTVPHAVMACAECGPVILEYVTECPLCPGVEGHEVYWVDLIAGLEHIARIFTQPAPYKLCRDAANELRALRDTIDSMQQAQDGAKRRAQELKARRLAEVIEDWTGSKLWTTPLPVSPTGLLAMPNSVWKALTDEVNDRYRSYHKPPSEETKALVAEMFTEPQEAGR